MAGGGLWLGIQVRVSGEGWFMMKSERERMRSLFLSGVMEGLSKDVEGYQNFSIVRIISWEL